MDYLVNFSDFLTSRFGQVGFRKPLVMGILNVTPDSFSDGGKFVGGALGGRVDVDAAVRESLQMVEEGADIIDIGGESSGPGSEDVSLEEELARVIPVVKKLSDVLGQKLTKVRNEFRPGAEMVEEFAGKKVLISVDTYKSEVARQAIFAGADMINDVTALRGDLDEYGISKMASVLAKCPNVPVVIMYSKDPTARTTRENVQYKDVIATVKNFLEERIAVGVAAGIERERFIVDPGMGAFVSGEPKYSFELLRRLGELDSFSLPILIGASRKGFLGGVVDQRLESSLACAAIAAYNGASILRVHDVKQTRRVVDMVAAIKNS